jgi:hypothetical protein
MKKLTKEVLIEWVESDPARLADFKNHVGDDRTVREYLDQYAYRRDIVEGLASDLGYYDTIKLKETDPASNGYYIGLDR